MLVQFLLVLVVQSPHPHSTPSTAEISLSVDHHVTYFAPLLFFISFGISYQVSSLAPPPILTRGIFQISLP